MTSTISFGFKGNERFEVQEYLGAGTSGEVFRVYDRKMRTHVALKTLHRADPSGLFLFKNEFRALAGVNHPNLVQLYELLSEGDQWFFTMELVEGHNFVDYIRAQDASDTTLRTLDPDHPDTISPNLNSLRDVMRQLAEGLCFLHRSGKLHCDIKPSNIRVTDQGRLVLLDFGLVRELFSDPAFERSESTIIGTPAYMSPEQAIGQPITEAGDWYSVGVVLFEALTGVLPFTGTAFEILRDKREYEAPSPALFLPELPEDLTLLCQRLLKRLPEERPTGSEVLDVLGGVPLDELRSPAEGMVFVGRERHLGELEKAFDSSREGGTVVVYVHGSSGLGKSSLVQHFLGQISRRHASMVVLSGRCFERETMPYKAVDALIDALAHYLRSLPRKRAEVLLPTNVIALAQLFPTLYRVEAIARAQRKILDIPDEREKTRRARAALRELFARLGERKPVVLFIDDLQWGDTESADLLADLLRPPDPPPLMLIACYRTEEEESSPLLRALLKLQLSTESTEVHEINLGPLTLEEGREMGLRLLGSRSVEMQQLALSIAREANGSPFFISELVHYWQAQTSADGRAPDSTVSDGTASGETAADVTASDEETPTTTAVEATDKDGLSSRLPRGDSHLSTLDRLILARLERLPEPSRKLFEIVAVTGHPLDLEVAVEAAQIDNMAQAAVTDLRSASLVRLRDAEVQEIEPYHDRIRQSLMQAMPTEEREALHLRLAKALEIRQTDPEILALHYREAGEHRRASILAIEAAHSAAKQLAFDRAARFFHTALALPVHDRETERELQIQLADMLTKAGRGQAASDHYLAACEGAGEEQALELKRKAAAQLLTSGYIREGLEIISDVLRELDLDLPESTAKRRMIMAYESLRLSLRGMKFEARPSEDLTPREKLRIDSCWAVARGLSNVDLLAGTIFSLRHVALAMQSGDTFRAARALALETAYSAIPGARHRKRTERLRKMALKLAQKVPDPYALGLANTMAGVSAFREGDWRLARDYLERGEIILREQCTGVSWELDTVLAYRLRTLQMTGDLAQIVRSLPGWLKDAEDRGDLYAETLLNTRVVWLAYLVADQASEARKQIDRSIGRWTEEGFHIQHYWHLTATAEIDLYRGKPFRAWQTLHRGWHQLEEAGLLKIQPTHAEAWHIRARVALACSQALDHTSKDGQAFLYVTNEGIKRLRKQKLAWASPLALLLRAGVASLEGKSKAAEEDLIAAAAGFETVGMGLYTAVSRLRRGQVLGGERGQEFMEAAESWMEHQEIQNVHRMSRALAPGAWD